MLYQLSHFRSVATNILFIFQTADMWLDLQKGVLYVQL